MAVETEDRILVKPVEQKEQNKGGIIIPDTAKEKPEEGKGYCSWNRQTLDNGQKKKKQPSKKATWYCLPNMQALEITIDGEKHMIMREDEILAVIEK